MVDTNELESFLNEKSVKEGDIVVILNEGNIEQKEDQLSHRKYKQLNLAVETSGRDLTYTPDKSAIEVLRKAFGNDSKKWVGKKFSVKLYPKKVFGKDKTAILPVILEVKA
jgi:hypothetical protein